MLRRLIPALIAWLRNPEIRVTVTPLEELERLRAEVTELRTEKKRRDAELLGQYTINHETMNTNRRLLTENELLRQQIQRYEHEIDIRDNPSPPPQRRKSKKTR